MIAAWGSTSAHNRRAAHHQPLIVSAILLSCCLNLHPGETQAAVHAWRLSSVKSSPDHELDIPRQNSIFAT